MKKDQIDLDYVKSLEEKIDLLEDEILNLNKKIEAREHKFNVWILHGDDLSPESDLEITVKTLGEAKYYVKKYTERKTKRKNFLGFEIIEVIYEPNEGENGRFWSFDKQGLITHQGDERLGVK